VLGPVVGIAVIATVPEPSHEAGHRVSEMERNRIGAGPLDVAHERAVRALDGVGLRREREVHRRLRERVVALRHPDEMHRLLRRRRDDQALRIREPDVLRREDDEPPGDEHRILPGVDHPHEPVQRAVGIGAPDALDERGYRVVVGVPGAVVNERAPLERLLDRAQVDVSDALVVRRGGVCRKLERVQRHPCVSIGDHDQRVERVRLDLRGASEPALVAERALDDEAHVVLGQGMKDEDPGP